MSDAKASKGAYKTWVDYTMNRPDQKLWMLESDEGKNLYFYKLQTWFMSKNHNYAESPTYHVWRGNKWVYAGMSYDEGYKIYLREKET